MLEWIKSFFVKKQGLTDAEAVKGLNAEQAAAYFAKKAAEAAARAAADAVPSGKIWPDGDIKFKIRSLEQSQIREWREHLSLEISAVEISLGKIRDLIDSPAAGEMKSLLQEITASHDLVKKFKYELKRLEAILKGEDEEHTVKLEGKKEAPETTASATN